ncbi:hypothetical protein FJZ27_05000 [Candidatus Peribacteria bacterium]|nr:hypothetical protein [Candidatus Peribacteria bacterium]
MSHSQPFSLPEKLSAIVADAAGNLPALTSPSDEVFLRMVFEEAVDAFWRMYLECLPMVERQKFVAAFDEPTGKAMLDWTKKHADFEHDSVACARGQSICDALGTKLQTCIAEAYAGWTPEQAAVTLDDWAFDVEQVAAFTQSDSAHHSS